jgi:hypothetical protein
MAECPTARRCALAGLFPSRTDGSSERAFSRAESPAGPKSKAATLTTSSLRSESFSQTGGGRDHVTCTYTGKEAADGGDQSVFHSERRGYRPQPARQVPAVPLYSEGSAGRQAILSKEPRHDLRRNFRRRKRRIFYPQVVRPAGEPPAGVQLVRGIILQQPPA